MIRRRSRAKEEDLDYKDFWISTTMRLRSNGATASIRGTGQSAIDSAAVASCPKTLFTEQPLVVVFEWEMFPVAYRRFDM